MLMTSFIEDLRPLVQVVKCYPPYRYYLSGIILSSYT